MVVPAGVVDRRPAQQPDVDVGVAVQGGVDPLVVVEADEVGPAVRVAGQCDDQLLELGRLEIAALAASRARRPTRSWISSLAAIVRTPSCSTPGSPRTRRGLVTRTARAAASPPTCDQRSGATGAAYGRSLPSTRASIPSTRTSASRPCGPYDEVSTCTSGSTAPVLPPLAAYRSWCTGARPAPAANTTRSVGWAARTSAACHAHQAACSWAAYPTTAGHHAGSEAASGSAPPAPDGRARASRRVRRPRAQRRGGPTPTGSAHRSPAPARRRTRARGALPGRRGRARPTRPRPTPRSPRASRPPPRARRPASPRPTGRAATRCRAAPTATGRPGRCRRGRSRAAAGSRRGARGRSRTAPRRGCGASSRAGTACANARAAGRRAARATGAGAGRRRRPAKPGLLGPRVVRTSDSLPKV